MTLPAPPRVPARWRDSLVECARWEWRVAQGGNPHGLLETFLREHGLPVAELAARAQGVGAAGGVVGAAILVGAAAIAPDVASALGTPRRTCAEVPDAVAVIYKLGDARPAAAAAAGTAGIGAWMPSWSPAEHAAAVDQVRTAIARGDVYQVNLVGHTSARYTGDAAAIARAVCGVAAAPYAGALAGEGWLVASASPEGFIEVRDGVVRTRPIKGTATRAADQAADESARDRLQTSAKDRAEHVMIVDLERNDLARVAADPVRVPTLYAVRPLAGLWHAESVVEAPLRAGVGLAELLGATFPGGSVTGAPKLAALAQISALEPTSRGPAMGALGWVGADGTVDLGLTIRTVAIAAGRVHLWAGGGITWGSDATAEVAEAAAKAAPIRTALSALQA
ncbi:MAG: chorismate-binding protein [Frankia sp.]|nr:chorismate-binding protein [Frankia sp.]